MLYISVHSGCENTPCRPGLWTCATGDYVPGYDITIVTMLAEMSVNTNRINSLILNRSVIIMTCLSSHIIAVQAIDIYQW